MAKEVTIPARWYICSREYNFVPLFLAERKEKIRIPVGTPVKEALDCIWTTNNQKICLTNSQNGRQHFAINEDGNGLERGKITWAMNEAARNTGYGVRFTPTQQYIIFSQWGKYVRLESDALLFNDAFYVASIYDLRRMCEDVWIDFFRGQDLYMYDIDHRLDYGAYGVPQLKDFEHKENLGFDPTKALVDFQLAYNKAKYDPESLHV